MDSRWFFPAATIVLIIVVVEVLSRTGTVSSLVLPASSSVFASMIELFQQEYFWTNFGVTMFQAAAGFVVGGIAGFGAGTFIYLNNIARKALYPIAVAVQSTPQVAIAPLFLIWFGFGMEARIVFAATSCFFPVLVAVVAGLSSADSDSRTLMRSFGTSTFENYRYLLLPNSIPMLFSGILIAVPMALIGSLVGEFVGGNLGLGVMINTFISQLNMAASFAIIIVLAVVGIVSYKAVEVLERVCVRWRYHV
jgi:NitT/TauT family transport system permease protein